MLIRDGLPKNIFEISFESEDSFIEPTFGKNRGPLKRFNRSICCKNFTNTSRINCSTELQMKSSEEHDKTPELRKLCLFENMGQQILDS